MVSAAGVLAIVPLLTAISATLPSPTGAFEPARVTLLIEDPFRIEPLDPKANVRRVMVDIWYPAEPSRTQPNAPARYLDFTTFERALGTDALHRQFGASYDAIKADVPTHAHAEAAFNNSLRRAPVLIFSPGGGMIRELYTSQMEDLASNGYIVAALTHSYDGFLSVLPDGNYIAYDARRWPKIPSFEGEANLNQLEWHTDDILLVLNQLERLNNEPSSTLPISGHMDMTRVGAFGHSFGGVAAAHACQKDKRIRACLNQDGAMAMKPFYPDARGWGMDQPFMFIERPSNRQPLADADLAQMKVTREQATRMIEHLNASRDRLLRNTGTASYRVLLQRNMTTHMDFSDLPLLAAKNAAEQERPMAAMKVIRSYTRAFFDRYLRGTKEPLLERNVPDPLIESIERTPVR